tara:strand:+ start:139 stop:726 length:588 start_codon:yes stop_codon:yes gene_type:complete
MGSRRLGRKRLYSLEKKGQKIDLESGPGIASAILYSTQTRQGHEIITEIAVDLGVGGIIDSGTGGNGAQAPVGKDGELAFVAELTEANFGIITEVRAVMTEVPTGGTADIDLEFGNDTAGKSASGGAGTKAAGATSIMTALTAKGEDTSTAYDANDLSGKFLYICQGANATSAEYTAGKILIYIHGFVDPVAGTF